MAASLSCFEHGTRCRRDPGARLPDREAATTPDVYPLTLNALRLACSQSTNRDPVVDYDENTIRSAIERLVQRKWATLASWSNRRSMKYRHTLDGALGLDDAEISVLTLLMLRGAQTPGELKARTERLHSFGDMGELTGALGRLIERGPRRAPSIGARGSARRYTHLLGEDEAGEPEAALAAPQRRRPSRSSRSAPCRAGRDGPGSIRRRAHRAHRAAARGAPRGDQGAPRGARRLS